MQETVPLLLFLILLCLLDIWRQVPKTPPLVKTSRDYYAVDVLSVTKEGRELVTGNKADGYGIMHKPIKIDESDHRRDTWTGEDAQGFLSQEIIVFEDYAAATKYADEASKGTLLFELAREVVLWWVPAETKAQVIRGVGSRRLHTWPSKFSPELD